MGILGDSVADARIADNDFAGEGYGAVVAATSAGWRIRDNDFCGLVPPSAQAHPVLSFPVELPVNQTQAIVVLVDSVDIRVTNNHCA